MKKLLGFAVLILIGLHSFDGYALKVAERNGANRIYSLERIMLGAVQQTILITGKDSTRPVLLWLHGGPAFSEMALVRKYDRDLDNHFIVVNWDQRGTNLSYSPTIPKSSMTIHHIVSDAHELITLLKKRFHRKKIFLLGHSFGSAVGLLLACTYPQDFYAYIGVGQVVNMQDNERLSVQFALQMAQKENNQQAIRELKRILPYPSPTSTLQQLYMARKWMAYYGGQVYGQHDARSTLSGVADGTNPLFDPLKFSRGMDFSMETLWAPFLKTDFPQSIPELGVPVWFLLGKHDYNVPYTLAKRYFKQLKAPAKKMILFEHSAHVPPFEESQKFVAVMAQIARTSKE